MSGFCTEVGVLSGLLVEASIEMWISVDRNIALLPFCRSLVHVESSSFQSENKPSPREPPQCVAFAKLPALSWSPHCVALWAESK